MGGAAPRAKGRRTQPQERACLVLDRCRDGYVSPRRTGARSARQITPTRPEGSDGRRVAENSSANLRPRPMKPPPFIPLMRLSRLLSALLLALVWLTPAHAV